MDDLAKSQAPEWLKKQFAKQYGKLKTKERENEELKKILSQNGIPIPEKES